MRHQPEELSSILAIVPNTKYANSTRRENLIKKNLEKEGWYAVRSSGSHGIADVIGIRPATACTDPAHYEVKFIQVKTSQSIKEEKVTLLAEDSPCGFINVEFHFFPVKNKFFLEAERKRKEKDHQKKHKMVKRI